MLLHGLSGRPSWRSGTDCHWPAWCPNCANYARPAPFYGQLLPSDLECRLRLHHRASTSTV
eukprot:558387-Lingulodinium_polyedra.AAC.1